MSAITVDPLGPDAHDGALWTSAALIVAAVHVALVAGYLLLRPPPAERAEAPAIDVAFMPAADKPAPAAPEALSAEPAPPAEQSDLAPPVAEPEPAPPPPPPVALTVPAPPAPPDEATITAPPPAAIEPPPPPPKPVTAPERPAPKPAAEDDKAEKAKREKAEQQKKEKEAKEKEARRLAQQRAAASSASQAQRMAAAPNAGLESEGARAGQANWNSELAAQIRRNAAYPADGGGASGTVQISVSINRNGRLLSHHLAASSGSPALDRAAMAIIERAQPFPPFPAGMTQAQVSRTVPLHLRPR